MLWRNSHSKFVWRKKLYGRRMKLTLLNFSNLIFSYDRFEILIKNSSSINWTKWRPKNNFLLTLLSKGSSESILLHRFYNILLKFHDSFSWVCFFSSVSIAKIFNSITFVGTSHNDHCACVWAGKKGEWIDLQ